MQQLSEMDYSMLQIENNRTPNHISLVLFYDQSEVEGGIVRFKEILNVFNCNLHKSTVFRRKLAGETSGLDTPYWIEDRNFDLEFHVRHIALPKPGDWRQLCIQVARLHSRGVDLARPPWEVYVIEGLNKIEGLPENSFAMMLKIHHAAVDGVSMAAILNGIHSLTADEVLEEVDDDWKGEPDPEPLEVWKNAFRNNLRRPVKLVRTLSDLLPKLNKNKDQKKKDSQKQKGVKTRLNNLVSPHRVVDSLIIDLDKVKNIKNTVEGATVNDVIVSLVGGGLRKYLQAKGELPKISLSTAVPVSVRDPDDPAPTGNQVSMLKLTLASNIEDPIERLKAVGRSSRQSKEFATANGMRTVINITEGLFPPIMGAAFKMVAYAAESDDLTFPYQTIVSNVPGAQGTLYLAGAKLTTALLLGPLSDGLGLFNGVISTGGKITITATACRKLMPDPEFYKACLQETWDELYAATTKLKGRSKSNKPRTQASSKSAPAKRATAKSATAKSASAKKAPAKRAAGKNATRKRKRSASRAAS